MKLNEIKAYYINLDKDEEKRDSMEKMLSRLEFNYERFPAVCESWGCEKSHYKLLSEGLKAPFIILEDDCNLKKEVVELETPENIDMIYLGVSGFGYFNGNISCVLYDDVSEDVFRIYNMLSTHAMLYLSDDFAKIVKQLAYYCGYKVNQNFDKSIAEIQKYYEIYALNTPMFYQDNYNKPHTYMNLGSYNTTQNINDNPIPNIIRYETIKFK